MTAFLFQATEDHYALPEHLVPGNTIWWWARRYRSLMRPGSLVFFWQAGRESARGLHGWGDLAGHPFPHDDDFRVNVTIRCRLTPHIPAATVRAIPALRDHAIFTVRTGSNFLLEDEEVQALIALLPEPQRPVLAQV